jgi:hypothetical protein
MGALCVPAAGQDDAVPRYRYVPMSSAARDAQIVYANLYFAPH